MPRPWQEHDMQLARRTAEACEHQAVAARQVQLVHPAMWHIGTCKGRGLWRKSFHGFMRTDHGCQPKNCACCEVPPMCQLCHYTWLNELSQQRRLVLEQFHSQQMSWEEFEAYSSSSDNGDPLAAGSKGAPVSKAAVGRKGTAGRKGETGSKGLATSRKVPSSSRSWKGKGISEEDGAGGYGQGAGKQSSTFHHKGGEASEK